MPISQNGYGIDLQADPNIGTDIEAAFKAVEPLNSDNDPGRFTNLEEIIAGTQPGWTEGDPVPSTVTGDLDPTTGNNPPVVSNPGNQTNDETDNVTLQIDASDADNDTLSYSAIGLPAGLSIDGSTGEIYGAVSYDAVLHPDTWHDYTVEVTVDDGTDSDSTIFTWTVFDLNRDPVAVADSANIDTSKDTSVDVQVLDNDSDADGDSLLITNVTTPAGGSVTDDGAIITYTPDLAGDYVDIFDYTIEDGFGGSDTVDVTVNVTGLIPNEPPSVTTPAAQENTETDSASLQIAATDPDGDSLAYSASGLPADLSIDPNSGLISGTVSYDAVLHPAIQDIYEVFVDVDDGVNVPVTVVFDWTVNDLNRPPSAVNDGPFNVIHDTDLIIAVLANDSDPDGDALTVLEITNHPANGSVVINGDNTLTYTPDAGFVGDDPFTYTIDDGFGGISDPATVQLTVTNEAPVAEDDLYGTDKKTTLMVPAPGVLGNDSDADGDVLSATITALPSIGTVSLNPDGSFTYVPDGTVGQDSFRYVASDGIDDSNEATVTINVSDVNDPPMVETPADQTDDEGDSVSLAIVADDPNGDTLTYSASGLPDNLSIDPNSGVISGTVSFDAVAHPDLSAVYSVTVVVDDGSLSDSATFDWSVNDVNRDPVAVEDAATTDPNTEVTVAVLANDSDADGDALNVAGIELAPLNGSVTINNDDTITYTPDTGFSGTDNFDYGVDDGFGGADVARVTINVTNVPPVAEDDAYGTEQDVTLIVTAPGVLANDTDADGDPLTAILKSIASSGTVTMTDNGAFSYTPNAGFVGDDSFTYVANDGFVDSNLAIVTITVTEGNQPPVADAGGPYAALVDETINFDGSGSTDPDGGIVRYDWDFGDGTIAEDAGPNPTHSYSAAFVYDVSLTVTDDLGASDQVTTTATISEPENLPPVADADGPYTGTEGEAVTFDGSGSSDPDGTIVRYDWDFGDGTLAEDAGPSPTHTYVEGSYDVSLTVTDDDGLTDSDVTTAVIGPPPSPDDADVFLSKMRVPNLLALREGREVKRRILIFGDGDTISQDATVTLTASSSSGEVEVEIEPESITSSVSPGRSDTRFTFNVEIECGEVGEHEIEWTATIDAAENADPTNDTLTGTTSLICMAASSRGQ